MTDQIRDTIVERCLVFPFLQGESKDIFKWQGLGGGGVR